MHLVANLEERNIRVLGIEGVDPATRQPGLPPILRGGRGPQQTTPDLPKAPTARVVQCRAAAATAGVALDRGRQCARDNPSSSSTAT